MQKLLEMIRIPLGVATVIAVAYLFYVFLARHQADRRYAERNAPSDAEVTKAAKAFEDTYGGKDLKILQFYAREGQLIEGHSTVLCYGVLNAKTVKIDPPVDGVAPALNRCVEVSPKHDTTYTMTADDGNGKTVTAQASVHLEQDMETVPRITSFTVQRHTVESGRHVYLLGFAFQNGKEVSIDPPVFSPMTDSAPFGQFFVSPEKTTTYTLTVTGPTGHKAQKKLTLDVKD